MAVRERESGGGYIPLAGYPLRTLTLLDAPLFDAVPFWVG